jgi:putative DNA primase/helicase
MTGALLMPLDAAERLERQSRQAASRAEPIAAGLVAVALVDFLAMKIPPREYIVDPIIQRQGLAMIHAQRGVGKTHVALSLAYAVATGGNVLRWSCPKPRRVLLIDGEMPARTMQERLAALVEASHAEPPSPDFLRLVTPDLQAGPIPNIATPEGHAAVEQLIGDGVELLILDNLSSLCRGGVENDAESWEPMQTWLLRLRARGLSVLFVHHAGKGGAQRGTSKREDVLDTVICLKRPTDYLASEGARFEVHLEKARGIVGEAANPFEARLESGGRWSMRSLDDATEARVAELTADGMSVREIASELGISKSKVQRLKDRSEARNA